MLKKELAVVVILIFILSSLIPIASSYSSYETNKIYSIHIDENGTLSGYVTDSAMNPIKGAKVRVYFHETYEENYTDSSGYYHVTNIPLCYCLKNATVSKKGYISEYVLLSIDETTIHNFVLTPLGNTLYVGGNGPNNYTSIQDGIDNASDGDTIFVYSGTYYENVVVDKALTLLGEEKETTIIDGNKSGDVIYISADWVNISGFTIKNSGNQSSEAGIEINSNYTILSDNNFSNNQYGIYLTYSDGNNILKNNISNNSKYGIYLYAASDANIISNNIPLRSILSIRFVLAGNKQRIMFSFINRTTFY